MDNLALEHDRADFLRFLEESGISKAQAWQQMRTLVWKATDLEAFGLQIQGSPLGGVGLFTVYPIGIEQLVCPARIGNVDTEAGRFTNHSASPNCVFRWCDAGIGLISKREISPGEELTCDYRHPELVIMTVET